MFKSVSIWIENNIKTILFIFLMIGLIMIYYPTKFFPSLFPSPDIPFNTYEFKVGSLGLSNVDNLHFDFNFSSKKVILSFSTKRGKNSTITIDFPTGLELNNVTIQNLKNTDYNFNVKNENDSDQIYRKSVMITPFKNITSEKIEIILKGEIYPKGFYLIKANAEHVSDAYNGGISTLDFNTERVNFILGNDIICQSPCISNSLFWQNEDFSYFIIPTNQGQNIKISYQNNGLDQRLTSFIINTINEKNRHIREVVIALGISLFSGAIISLSTIMQSQTTSTLPKKKYFCNRCRKNHHFNSKIGHKHFT